MLNMEGHRVEVETFIEEVMEIQRDEGTRGFAIELDQKYTIMADEMRFEDELILSNNGDDIFFIPEEYSHYLTYQIVVDYDCRSLIIGLAEV